MRTEQILSSDILDIVFDNRNKSYGAYDLRKFYGNRLAKALLLTFSLTGAAVLSVSFLKKEKISRPQIPDIVMVNTRVHTLEPVEIVAPKQKPAQKQTAKVPGQKHLSNIVITKNEKEATPLAKNLDSVAISNTTQAGEAGEKLLVKGPEPGAENIKAPTAPAAVDKITPMYTAEVMPKFPGGMGGLRKFLQKNLQNPQDLEEGQVISVKIKFVVGYDGKLKSFETIEDGGKAFNNEVIRVLKRMPEWEPGRSNGENVSVYYTIPVKFTAAE